jgi:hypothetical protein
MENKSIIRKKSVDKLTHDNKKKMDLPIWVLSVDGGHRHKQKAHADDG